MLWNSPFLSCSNFSVKIGAFYIKIILVAIFIPSMGSCDCELPQTNLTWSVQLFDVYWTQTDKQYIYRWQVPIPILGFIPSPFLGSQFPLTSRLSPLLMNIIKSFLIYSWLLNDLEQTRSWLDLNTDILLQAILTAQLRINLILLKSVPWHNNDIQMQKYNQEIIYVNHKECH